jgi:hypothetical protein
LVEGLAETLKECYATGKMPSELGLVGLRQVKGLNSRGYYYFRGENIK